MRSWVNRRLCEAVMAIFAGLLPVCAAHAHCFVGSRFLPATLAIDDPCVADELSLPTVSWSKSADTPSTGQLTVSGELAKRITESLGIGIGTGWTHLKTPGSPSASGFENLDTTIQYQFVRHAARELAMSAAISAEWGGTGAKAVDADSFSTITPSLLFGKGLGNLPDTMGWARPLAITGQVGYSLPTRRSTSTVDPDTGLIASAPNPQFLIYGVTLQYSMPYLKSSVVDLNLPGFINHLIPIVEAQFSTPMANNTGTGIGTIGTINPGVIWVGNCFQVGIEAIVPVNHASGTGVGFLAQLHLYLDDIYPRTIGRPLFGASNSTPKPALAN
jgi:hypothetical protein